MNLPLRREEPAETQDFRPRLRQRGGEGPEQSPANQLLRLLEDANFESIASPREHPFRQARPKSVYADMPRMFGIVLFVWSILALSASVGVVIYDILREDRLVAAAQRPPLVFNQLAHRYVQSSEGPALELSGLVTNGGSEPVEPSVVLQLAGSRLAIEEPLRLGIVTLPPGAERPFTVRVLLPEGVESVRLLPGEQRPVLTRNLSTVSPAWTATP